MPHARPIQHHHAGLAGRAQQRLVQTPHAAKKQLSIEFKNTNALPLLCRELDSLEARARERFAHGFCALNVAQRQSLVDEARAQDPAFMSRLALETVTCYYQHDRVLEALGLETRPPYPQGFQVIAGDLTLLGPVRRRGKLYRDA